MRREDRHLLGVMQKDGDFLFERPGFADPKVRNFETVPKKMWEIVYFADDDLYVKFNI